MRLRKQLFNFDDSLFPEASPLVPEEVECDRLPDDVVGRRAEHPGGVLLPDARVLRDAPFQVSI